MTPTKEFIVDKLLVIGIDTLAGGNLALVLADRCEVLGVCRQHRFELEGCRTLRVESGDDAQDANGA